MLAIHISHDVVKYAQLVNFKGTPFIESLGKVCLKDGMQLSDMSKAEVISALSEQITIIRNSAEFPDNSTHIVIDSDWFPMGVHRVDEVLAGNDLEKYLKWYMKEMLEGSLSEYSLVHQALNRDPERGIEYLSMGIPQSFDSWITKVFGPSELEVKNVISEIQAIGDVLAASRQLDAEGGIQVVLENRENSISCHLYQNKEFAGLFQGALNWDFKITLDHIRGDYNLIMQVKEAIEKAIKGKRDPENVITNLYYFSSTGDPTVLNNLKIYDNSCQTLNLGDHFNFRDPDFENIDEYAVVLGALNIEIQERFSET